MRSKKTGKIIKCKVLKCKSSYCGADIAVNEGHLFFLVIKQGYNKGHYAIDISEKEIKKIG